MEQTIKKRRTKLVMAVIVMLFAGIIYAWSILKTPFEMFDDGMLANAAHLGVNYTITVICFCLGGFTAGLLSKYTTTTLRFVMSALMLVTSFISSSLQIVTLPFTENYILLFMSYGVLGGLGIGFAFNTVISTVNAWYPDKRGIASGAMLMGFGVSMLMIGNIADMLGRSDSVGWRNTYVILAIAIGIVFLTAAVVIKPPPKDTVFPIAELKKSAGPTEETKDYSAIEMIKRPSFILVFSYIAILASSGNAAFSFAKEILIDVGARESFAVTAVGALGISNGLGRFISGWLFDRLGLRRTQFISSTILILAPLTVALAILVNSLVLCLIGLCLCGFSLGFAPTTGSVFASVFYGQKNFALNFGILGLVLIPAPFAAVLAGSIKASTGGFMPAFLILTALTVVGFIINLAIRKP
jgi:OFA family oxalate/formate antiporter-like MFS transporter